MPKQMLHDNYGKQVMSSAAGSAYSDHRDTKIVYGPDAGWAVIDGTVGASIAVEIESRTGKQVRGAVLDLLWHPFPKKLLLVVPVHMQNPVATANQCRIILGRDRPASDFQVVVLEGTGNTPQLNADSAKVRAALEALGWG